MRKTNPITDFLSNFSTRQLIAAAVIGVGTWGSTVYATAQDAKIRVVTAGAAKAVPVKKVNKQMMI